jgi:hypothetical protein
VVSFVNIIVILSLDELNFSLCRGIYSNLVDISVAFMLMKPVKENTESSSVHLMSFRVFPEDPFCEGRDCIFGMTVICFRFKNKQASKLSRGCKELRHCSFYCIMEAAINNFKSLHGVLQGVIFSPQSLRVRVSGISGNV